MSNILKRRGVPPAPDRKKTTTWKEFIRSHLDVLWATDFFSTEVWTLGGLVTFYILFFIKLDTREVHIAGITSTPNEPWMMQIARNLTMNEWGILKPGHYLIHDRDKKFCLAYNQLLDDAGVKRLPLPPRSPNLNAMNKNESPVLTRRLEGRCLLDYIYWLTSESVLNDSVRFCDHCGNPFVATHRKALYCPPRRNQGQVSPCMNRTKQARYKRKQMQG